MSKSKQHKVEIYFTTCTIGEAVSEINIMLERAGYPLITSDNCTDCYKADCEDDWFEDYNFIFETTLSGILTEIEQKLSDAGLSYEVVD